MIQKDVPQGKHHKLKARLNTKTIHNRNMKSSYLTPCKTKLWNLCSKQSSQTYAITNYTTNKTFKCFQEPTQKVCTHTILKATSKRKQTLRFTFRAIFERICCVKKTRLRLTFPTSVSKFHHLFKIWMNPLRTNVILYYEPRYYVATAAENWMTWNTIDIYLLKAAIETPKFVFLWILQNF